uniref:Armadillo repeat-containing domain-containing protein n=1 Tax=Ascaris lumbricoides TaxID=6252 RepID=A0A9J2PAI8_ASCLU
MRMDTAFGMYRMPHQAYSYEQQMPSTSYGSACAPVAPSGPCLYGQPHSIYPRPRVPYPPLGRSVPSSPMGEREKQQQYIERGEVDARKIMNTQTWMADHRFTLVAQQHCRSGSSPASVISRMTRVSNATDDMSMLSVNTQMTDVQQLTELRAAQHSSAPSSSSSCVENVDPNKREKYAQAVDNYLDKINSNINTSDKKMFRDILRAIFMMTTRNDFDRADTEKLGAMMYALIQNWLRQNDLEIDIVDTILRVMSNLSADGRSKQIIARWMTSYADQLLETFVRRMDPSQKYCKYALNTVHSLVEMVERSRYGKRLKEEIINRAVGVMREMELYGDRYFIKTSKSKQYVFDLLRRIYNGDDELRSAFEANDGIRLLLELLKKEMNELVVYRIIRALYAVVCSQDSSKFGERFANLGGVQTVSYLLANPHCSDRVALESIYCLRVVSDLEVVRSADNKEAISRILGTLERYNTNVSFVNVAVDFLGNVAANKDGTANMNKDFIVECGAIERLVAVLISFESKREESGVKSLLSSIIWALHIFTTSCSTPERTISARKQLVYSERAPDVLLYELANPVDLSSRLCTLNLFIRVVDADPLNHPPFLFSASGGNASLTDILFEVIKTTANTIEVNSKTNQKKLIIQKAYALLISLANCNLNFGSAIRFACSSYQIADLLLSCPDSDVIRSTIDFIMFVIKDETVREHLSKDCSLVESLRSLTAQMNENSASAQFLLFHLTAESEPMVSFAELL